MGELPYLRRPLSLSVQSRAMESSVIFIGHSPEDVEPAKNLEDAVASLGLSPLREPCQESAPDRWKSSVRKGFLQSDLVLLLWSRHAANSKAFEFECTSALESGKNIVLCRLDDTPAAPDLSSSRAVPLKDFTTAIPSLVQIFQNADLRGLSPKGSEAQTGLVAVPRTGAETMATAGVALPDASPRPQPSGGGADPSLFGTREIQSLKQIGGRYRVIRLLGRGGMGAVFYVHDDELDRDVALKVIRPDLAGDPLILQRFKREIQLSSTVTHRNVLRVYDLGESDGLKFLTMQYVEGGDLGGLLKTEGKLPVPRLIHLFRQICLGLEAAHERGIMHRDLKPSNIMIDSGDGVFLTDFGLAKSVADAGLTQAGYVMGTPHYMSPEQVKGAKVDLQSDIYSLGVILYEMATGKVPYTADSIYEVMMQRVQKPPRPPSELNPDLPPFLERIITRCMAIDKAARYATIRELLNDLDEGANTGRTTLNTKFHMRRLQARTASISWKKAAYVLPGILLFVVGGWWLWQRISNRSSPPAAVLKPVSVLVADFKNQTGNALLDGATEQILETNLEEASFVTTFNRGRARKIAGQLKQGASALDEPTARLVAAREGIDVIVDGLISPKNDGYHVLIRALDALNGKVLAQVTADSARKDDFSGALAKLSARIRKNLGDTTPESVQITAAETFTASSLESAKSYASAQELQGTGQWANAIPFYQRAFELDPNMGRAYAGLAVMYRNLGDRQKAEKYYQMAMARIDRMTERERHRTRGGYFITVGNQQKGIEEFSSLVKEYPADFVGHSNLALAYFLSRNMPQALEEGRRATSIYPKNVVMRSNLALYAMYAGEFETASREAREILKQDQSYGSAYVCLALSELAQDRSEQATDAYTRLNGLDASSASVAVAGLADLAFYQGRLNDAVSVLQKGISRDHAAKDSFMAARKQTALASVFIALGQTPKAIAEADLAVGESKLPPILLEAARVYIDAKREDKALALASQLNTRLEIDPRLYAKLIEGEVQLAHANVWDALRIFHEAQKLSDAWLVRLDLGRAYLAASAFTEAYSELEQCMKRRGEASAVFLDDIPTLRYLPPVYYYLGRAQQGLGSPAAAESYRTFLNIKSKATPDSLVDDAQSRLAALDSSH